MDKNTEEIVASILRGAVEVITSGDITDENRKTKMLLAYNLGRIIGDVVIGPSTNTDVM